ncbi:MAG: hypothetical protein K2G60_00215 [Oscillospiraceae bacterium]|nr:hypothetical protein [Oscillospiraceae bacterium]
MFYNQLKQACKKKGTSITAVLKKIGIGTANGTYWKNGSVPSSDIVVQLSEFLDVSTDYLLKGEERTTSNITQSTIGAIGSHSTGTVNVQSKEISTNGPNLSEGDETAQEITRILNKLSLKERSKLLTMIYDFEEECDQKSKK